MRRSGYLDRWNVDEGGGGKDNGNRRVAEAMTRHKFEASRRGARTRTTGADKDTRQDIELAGIVSAVSPIPRLQAVLWSTTVVTLQGSLNIS